MSPAAPSSDMLPVAGVGLGAGAGTWLVPVGACIAGAAGGPMGVDDIEVARVKRKGRLPSAGRQETTLGDADLPHLRISFLSGCESAVTGER